MHPAARAYVARTLGDGTVWPRVAEVGGRNINGGVRDLVPHGRWWSVDLEDGPDVDAVGDCRVLRPPWPADLVVCCEVLEHTPDPKGVLLSATGYLAAGGRLLVTCAGPGRAPHSGHDGMAVREGEHYGNISDDELRRWMVDAGLVLVQVEDNPADCDTYGTGVKR